MADQKYILKYAELPGVRVAYLDTGGSGAAIILLHATTGTSITWERQIDAFSKAGYRVIAPDRRGWGQSMVDPAAAARTDAEDVDALADHLKLTRFHLAGVGGGGLVALDYAAWRTERVICLIIASCIASKTEKEIADFSARIALPAGTKVPRHFTDVGASYRGSNPDGLARWIEIEHHARQPGASPVKLRTENNNAKLATIKARTLVMAGAGDIVAPPALMKLWAPRVKGSEWAVVPEAGHSIAWEQPESFNQTVLDFLSRAPR